MVTIKSAPISIGNKTWFNVTDQTVAGPTYSLEDVQRAGGQVPTVITVKASPKPERKPNRAERRRSR